MNDIGDIFKKQLENYQPEDNGALWQRLEQQMNAETVVPKAKQVKWKPWYTVATVAASAAVVVTMAGILWYNTDTKDSNVAEKETDKTEQSAVPSDSIARTTTPLENMNQEEMAQNETQENTKGNHKPDKSALTPKNKPYIHSDYTAKDVAAANTIVPHGVSQSTSNSAQIPATTPQQSTVVQNPIKSIPIDSIKTAKDRNAESQKVENVVDNTVKNTVKETVKETVNKDLELIAATFVTPNRDGHNDFFEVKNLANYDGNRLMVFNRNGSKIYDRTNYNNDWYCDDLEQGTYFYTLQVQKDGKTTVKQGSFVVMR